MNIKVGKWYRRRDGILTKIISYDPELGLFPYKCIRGVTYNHIGRSIDNFRHCYNLIIMQPADNELIAEKDEWS
jgi:hypothetical protein